MTFRSGNPAYPFRETEIFASATVILNRNSAVVLALVILFIVRARSLVHLRIAALQQDPCDAVRVFTSISIVLIAFAFVVRGFRQKGTADTLMLRKIYVMRSQQTIIIAIVLVLIAEIIALARHPAMWVGTTSSSEIIEWLGILTVGGIAAQLLAIERQRSQTHTEPIRFTRVGFIILAAVVALAICPEWPLAYNSATAHILTVALGGFVVLLSMRFLAMELVRFDLAIESREKSFFPSPLEWVLFVAGALLFTFGLLLDPMKHDSAARSLHLEAFALGITGTFLLSYALLAEPLGFSIL